MKPTSLLTAFCLLAGLPAAHAYVYYEDGSGNKRTWSSNSPRIRASQVGFPSGSTWRDKLGNIVDIWNDNPSKFYFDLTYDEATVALDNGQNEIWWSSDDDILDGDPATTYGWYSGRHIVEKDIIFDSRVAYTTSTTKSSLWPYGGSYRPFQTTLMHELGHALGLKHEDDEYNLMGEDWTHLNVNSDTVHYYPGEDACDGAVFLYDLYSPYLEDVSVTHWKYSGTDGEYSSHTRCVVEDSGGSVLAKLSGTSEDPVYKVNKGQVVKLEFTLENSGATTQSPLVEFYWSDDDNIITSDHYLASRTPSIGRNSVYTTTQTLTIPNTLTSGVTYYLGIIVDPDDTISEVREGNNATYVGIYIK